MSRSSSNKRRNTKSDSKETIVKKYRNRTSGNAKRHSGNLSRWYKEDWRNVCSRDSRGQYLKCGSSSSNRSLQQYPYCRPMKRISKETPRTIKEMSSEELLSMCRKKRRSVVKSRGKQTRVYQGASVQQSDGSSSRGLPRGTRFVKGSGKYKYTAILPDGKRVNFGHRDYQHYRDSVPKHLGGGQWSRYNHGDRSRRDNYRKRHGGVRTKSGERAYLKKYSPSWFSYHFLW